jgi:hypothetical protein
MATRRFLPPSRFEGLPMSRFTINALWLALLLLPRQAAIAGVIDSPECHRDLAMADQLIHAVRLRENSVQPGDFVGLCRLLRQNLQDMTRAREPMARCMTGHERGENVGQMDASLDDIRFVLSKHCIGR